MGWASKLENELERMYEGLSRLDNRIGVTRTTLQVLTGIPEVDKEAFTKRLDEIESDSYGLQKAIKLHLHGLRLYVRTPEGKLVERNRKLEEKIVELRQIHRLAKSKLHEELQHTHNQAVARLRERLTSRIGELQRGLSNTESELKRVKRSNSALSTRLAGYEARGSERNQSKLRNQADAFLAAADKWKEEKRTLVLENQRARKDIQRLEAENEKLKAQIEALRISKRELSTDHSHQVDELRKQLNLLQAQHESSSVFKGEAELARLKAENASIREEARRKRANLSQEFQRRASLLKEEHTRKVELWRSRAIQAGWDSSVS